MMRRRAVTAHDALPGHWRLLFPAAIIVALQGVILVCLALSASWQHQDLDLPAQTQRGRTPSGKDECRPCASLTHPAVAREELCTGEWPAARVENVPPKKIPEEFLEAFTLQGRIRPTYSYLAQVPRGKTHVWTDHVCERYYGLAQHHRPGYYGKTDKALWKALQDYPVRGLAVGVFGSVSPLYEATAAVFGAAKVTTVEYNAIRQDCEWGHAVDLQTITVSNFWSLPDADRERFDAVFSISSFEHDGLGRYGDPIDPFGDLRAISKLHRALQPNGLLFLAVPMNLIEDGLVWNLQRIYGPLRWPLLISGWWLLQLYGLDAECAREGETCQPVAVLQNCQKPL